MYRFNNEYWGNMLMYSMSDMTYGKSIYYECKNCQHRKQLSLSRIKVAVREDIRVEEKVTRLQKPLSSVHFHLAFKIGECFFNAIFDGLLCSY